MLKLVSTKVVPVTLELAKKFRDMAPLKNERSLKAKRARRAAGLIEAKQFFNLLWGSCEYNGVLYRGNGNHTSNLLTACMQAMNGELDEKAKDFAENYLFGKSADWSGETADDLPDVNPGDFSAVVEHFKADDEDDIAAFFTRYDPAVSARSNSDLLGVYQAEHDDLQTLSRDRVRHALNGVLAVYATEAFENVFGTYDPDTTVNWKGNGLGLALRNPQIRNATRWIVENVTDGKLYKNATGARLCATVFAKYGPESAAAILERIAADADEEVEPAASYLAQLNKKSNKPTPESLFKKGERVVEAVIRELNNGNSEAAA